MPPRRWRHVIDPAFVLLNAAFARQIVQCVMNLRFHQVYIHQQKLIVQLFTSLAKLEMILNESVYAIFKYSAYLNILCASKTFFSFLLHAICSWHSSALIHRTLPATEHVVKFRDLRRLRFRHVLNRGFNSSTGLINSSVLLFRVQMNTASMACS